MVTVKPFCGLRPKSEYAEKVASPPYDVVDTETAASMAEGNALSFLHVNRAEIDLPKGTELYDQQVYTRAGENLRALIQDGIFLEDSAPSMYLYRQTMDGRSQLGLVALVSADEYDRGLIKVHEKTLKRKEDDRVNYILGTNAHNEPVFLSYRSEPRINAVLNQATQARPAYDFVSDDQFGRVRHEFWVVNDESVIKSIEEGFTTLPALYVADGHHRTASAWRVWKQLKDNNPGHSGKEPYNHFLAVIFPHDQLFIWDYNRVVKDLNGLETDQFLTRVSESFTIEEGYSNKKPGSRHHFGLYLDKKWYLLKAREGSFDNSDPQKILDVSIIHDNLIEPILGISDPKTDPRIHFVGGILGMEELERLVDSGSFWMAVSLYPTSLEDVFNVADAGLLMPPKSTWFEPKLRSGLVLHPLS